MEDNFTEQDLPENYGRPIDQATFAILLAEMEKSLRKLRTLAHINRNILGVIDAVNSAGVDRPTLYAEVAQYIDSILDSGATSADQYEDMLRAWRDQLSRANPLIPSREGT